MLIIDGTSFPKQGTHSVGVARQYRGALGKIANCQVAVTAALWTGARAWMTGALLYLPKPWLTDADRRKLAARAYRLGRRALREVATIVTPETCFDGTANPSRGNGPEVRGITTADSIGRSVYTCSDISTRLSRRGCDGNTNGSAVGQRASVHWLGLHCATGLDALRPCGSSAWEREAGSQEPDEARVSLTVLVRAEG